MQRCTRFACHTDDGTAHCHCPLTRLLSTCGSRPRGPVAGGWRMLSGWARRVTFPWVGPVPLVCLSLPPLLAQRSGRRGEIYGYEIILLQCAGRIALCLLPEPYFLIAGRPIFALNHGSADWFQGRASLSSRCSMVMVMVMVHRNWTHARHRKPTNHVVAHAHAIQSYHGFRCCCGGNLNRRCARARCHASITSAQFTRLYSCIMLQSSSVIVRGREDMLHLALGGITGIKHVQPGGGQTLGLVRAPRHEMDARWRT